MTDTIPRKTLCKQFDIFVNLILLDITKKYTKFCGSNVEK